LTKQYFVPGSLLSGIWETSKDITVNSARFGITANNFFLN